MIVKASPINFTRNGLYCVCVCVTTSIEGGGGVGWIESFSGWEGKAYYIVSETYWMVDCFGVDEIAPILDYLYPALANEIQQPKTCLGLLVPLSSAFSLSLLSARPFLLPLGSDGNRPLRSPRNSRKLSKCNV